MVKIFPLSMGQFLFICSEMLGSLGFEKCLSCVRLFQSLTEIFSVSAVWVIVIPPVSARSALHEKIDQILNS